MAHKLRIDAVEQRTSNAIQVSQNLAASIFWVQEERSDKK